MRLRVRLALGMLALCPLTGQAMDPLDSLHWGVRVAAVMPDYTDADAAPAVGASLIYRHRQWPALALEFDADFAVADGRISRFDFFTAHSGAYLAWRSGGAYYLKARAGGLIEYVDMGPADAWGAGLAGGIGIGWRRDESLLEIELTGVDKAAYMISLAWYF